MQQETAGAAAHVPPDIFGTETARRATLLPSSRSEKDSAWHGHVAFAHWVVDAVRPRLLVELGTQAGVSYAAFCRAVKTLELETSCVAVDTWEGDIQTGTYGNDIFNDLNAYNEKHFSTFSRLSRCRFDDALSQFSESSIDLLHIDGLHTYDAVKHDFETWLPKMSDRGVVLFHDIAVRTRGFGVWRLWDELVQRYPSFQFMHSAGLGVLAVGTHASFRVQSLCNVRSEEGINAIRKKFELLADRARNPPANFFSAEPSIPLAAAEDVAGTHAIMRGWAMEQVAPWLFDLNQTVPFSAALEHLNDTHPNVFLYRISGRHVRLFDKPEAVRGWNYAMDYRRADSYRQYFEAVANRLPPEFATQFAVYVADGTLDDPKVPIFSFQKPAGNKCILLPDPDMIGRGFPSANDKVAFNAKRCCAVFVGATSGGIGPLTRAAILRDGASDRIRAAEFFRGSEDVIFKLPILVQYDGPETAELLRSKGYGDGRHVSWNEQLQNKFVISMDGNGATCTRVSITLSSNSVLLKYDSNSRLYYFSGLIPWVHYIPISEHQTILRVIEAERRNPGLFLDVSEAAKRFAANFLSREATIQYTAALLELYEGQLATKNALDRAPSPDCAPSLDCAPPASEIAASAHLQKHGDVVAGRDGWVGFRGSRTWVEGITLEAQGEISPEDLSYQTVGLNGVPSELARGGFFCGTRGMSSPISGFRIVLSGDAARNWILSYYGWFIDGRESGPCNAGELCSTSEKTPLEAYKLVLRPRLHSPSP
jgi:hypothetical protein